MKKIFKYPLKIEYREDFGVKWDRQQEIEMPSGAQILSVALQDGKPMLWALVNPEADKERRTIYVANTGGELADEVSARRFIGTLIFGSRGDIVLHVWE